MKKVTIKFTCENCGKELKINTKKCKCGSEFIKKQILIENNLIFHSRLKGLQKRPGFKRPLYEFIKGWFPSTNKKIKNGVLQVRIIDRIKDLYKHVVIDYFTKKIIHIENEKLSKHK